MTIEHFTEIFNMMNFKKRAYLIRELYNIWKPLRPVFPLARTDERLTQVHRRVAVESLLRSGCIVSQKQGAKAYIVTPFGERVLKALWSSELEVNPELEHAKNWAPKP